MIIWSAKPKAPLFMSAGRRHFAHWKIEHTVPLYERKSRAKLKREKQVKKSKVQILHLGRNARLVEPSRVRVGSSSSYIADADLPHEAIQTKDINVEDLAEPKLDQWNASLLTFTYAKRLFFMIRRKENEELLKNVNNANLVHVSVFMVKKNVRCRSVEEEFLRRVGEAVGEEVHDAVGEEEHDAVGDVVNDAVVQTGEAPFGAPASPPDNDLLRVDNLYHVLEFIHHIGLNNIAMRQRGYHAWGFTKLKRIYNAILIHFTNKMILSKGEIMEVLSLNDKYLYFDEYLFDYIDGNIASTFDTYDEHDISYLCRHLNKILFFFSLQKHGIKCDWYVHRLVKRYVCKSLVCSPHLEEEMWNGKDEGVVLPHGDDRVSICSEDSPPLLVHNFKERIRKSSFVRTLNKELRRSAHEYKYYNLVELLEFYTLFEIKKKEMIKRFINEVDKYINIMKYAYHAKALILFSLNTKYLDEENQKSIRRLIRRTSQMLHFYWPVEFILETIIACCSFLDKGNKTTRNLFLYLKANIKKCIHPVLLVNLLKSLASRQIRELTVCNQIMNYVKEKRYLIHEFYVVQILKYLSVLKYPNDDLFIYFLNENRALSRFSRLPSESLVSLLQVVNHYRGVHHSGGEKEFRVGNVFVRSSASVFFSEYVMFLLLRRNKRGMQNIVHEEANSSCSTDLPQSASPNADAFVQLLNALTNLKVTNQDILQYAVSYLQENLTQVRERHVVTLFQFFSEHLINCPSVGESLTRQTYVYLHQIAKNTIMKLPEEYLIHCAFSVLAYYFSEIVLNRNKKNVDLLEKLMIIFGDKIRAGLNILTEENEEKKASYELLHVISAVLKIIYEKMERRLPDELFNLCTHIQKNLTAATGEAVRGGGTDQKMPTGEYFIFFFSDLFKRKKISHFVNYISYPYTIDIVIPGRGEKDGLDEESRKRALFLINSFDQMYLKNVPVGRFFDELEKEHIGEEADYPTTEQRTVEAIYQNEEVRTCLKPYEAIREWFLNSQNYAVSYVSMADWKSKYM
ncbi:conserved Plasmodium protein, unknown function [Plasmodium knowlesi strain H]|uniref:Uncharacterized protein n=3 Tax=Plasmodium knowlesi TaxID=5850 RepID=A0A5K1V457_PLAKH|nr:conserved Plasmodium protein, unknown function [Plasmodium knowlesi strain H]OTN68284.1 Uncharacterized protein PKNOH_S03324200 [Plasmodium knowlesi]CAA9987144.1 conserved Plasmodium protein, unknown function [Plasmodium knowlesi strain H]SBO23897.1 conserved Plasmodium protein, unknown function [Plasmodium knowlesi strain H]SBO25748.1 conserved Plasmodium protein, unknown function [Plasmodium knowlesi strain H]VVS76618.1 conserved Plasmodium protein, unknown function [Plasmodium knowlesi s|eukprot:XP_002261766.1 hypothetical protein, conserved in Plasmodium species [Plasmodium knowlesi strain H]